MTTTETIIHFSGCNCVLSVTKYRNGRTALSLYDAATDEPIGVATVNLPDVPLGENEVLIKDYSENTGMLKALTDAGIVRQTGEVVPSGYVLLPVCQLLI